MAQPTPSCDCTLTQCNAGVYQGCCKHAQLWNVFVTIAYQCTSRSLLPHALCCLEGHFDKAGDGTQDAEMECGEGRHAYDDVLHLQVTDTPRHASSMSSPCNRMWLTQATIGRMRVPAVCLLFLINLAVFVSEARMPMQHVRQRVPWGWHCMQHRPSSMCWGADSCTLHS